MPASKRRRRTNRPRIIFGACMVGFGVFGMVAVDDSIALGLVFIGLGLMTVLIGALGYRGGGGGAAAGGGGFDGGGGGCGGGGCGGGAC